jgi:uncharacterized protein with FMN-binding domain
VRIRAFVVAAAASGVVILTGWEMGAQHATPMIASSTTTPPAPSAPAPQGGSTAAPSTTTTPSPSAPAAATTSSTDGTFTGALEQSPFGTVQVSVTITGGKLTDVKTPQLTETDGHSQRIDDYAIPILRSSVIGAQSAKVNSVSGATYTSDAYLQSLQSALDKAHFAG